MRSSTSRKILQRRLSGENSRRAEKDHGVLHAGFSQVRQRVKVFGYEFAAPARPRFPESGDCR